jgi:hypothetical protein
MKITTVETVRLGEFPNVLWVRVHTDEGLVGLGETFYAVAPVEAHIHETCAPYLLGKDPLEIERHSRNFLQGYLGFKSVGVEMRAASAIDIALWDLFGKAAGQPLYQLLGGKCRDRIRVYNTCAGYRYVRAKPVQTTANWGLPTGGAAAGRPYEDLDAFLHRADELALSLAAEGYTGMKIWPFDEYAESSNGTRISPADLKKALAPFEKIRRAVGDDMDIHVEFHSLWDLPTAIEIAQALAPPAVLVRGPDQDDEPRRARRLSPPDERPRHRERDARDALGVPGALRAPGDERGDAGRRLVRRRFGGEEDRHDGRGVSPPDCSARLHRPGRAHRFGASCAELPERLGAGGGAGLLFRLVSGTRHRPAAARPGIHHRPGGGGPGHRPPP